MNLVEETIAAGRAKDRTRFTALWMQLHPAQRLEVEAAARLNMIRVQQQATYTNDLTPAEPADPVVECPRCGGHGKDKQGRPCSVCKGEGEIPRELLYGERP